MRSEKFEVSGREMGILNNMLNYLCHAIPFNSELMRGGKDEFMALLSEINQLDFQNDSELNFDLPKLKKLQTAFLALEQKLKDDQELDCVVDEADLVWGLQTRLDGFIANAK